jgi:hypothetical protein
VVVAGVVKSKVSKQMSTLHETRSALDDIVYCDDQDQESSMLSMIETYLILQKLMRSRDALNRSAKTRSVGYAGFWKVRPL